MASYKLAVSFSDRRPPITVSLENGATTVESVEALVRVSQDMKADQKVKWALHLKPLNTTFDLAATLEANPETELVCVLVQN